ncbi:MAG TPA: SagB/ThcOx family dehydrogenase [Vicinamibacterales bacterium]|nr:SagB/ThcOx family dehydrogenase [Vicinamibacterales bacterium]
MSHARAVYRYHDGTKHHFTRFARSLGYLDWASQPNPFRSFPGAPSVSLQPASHQLSPIAAVLRHSLGLSAWKQFGQSRWSLRVNPSSGNLHPTEAYVIVGGEDGRVCHYAPDRHALEQRCAFDAPDWRQSARAPMFLVALTSVHWREAWKYGERAFRYCQHDLGHAIAAVRIAASLHGLQARILPDWSHQEMCALTGIDREEDYLDAEREEPGCVLLIGDRMPVVSREHLLASIQRGRWTGHASQLSEDHVQWTIIDEIAAATRDFGQSQLVPPVRPAPPALPALPALPAYPAHLLLQRRSAVALDGCSSTSADSFFAILARALPSEAPPWDAVWWDARIHLALFVHRVDGVEPGLYLLVRHEPALVRLREACRREFLWTRAHDALPLFLLARGDCRALARRLSCDQDIAADGFFSLGMIADFDAALTTFGDRFYRHLFWESGVVGQMLYLEAEAAGARGTGIGCFYDDPVHDVLGLRDHAFQSLYHFTIGIPVEDRRLTTAPGYEWEIAPRCETRSRSG